MATACAFGAPVYAQAPIPINCTISPNQIIELSAPLPGVVAEVAVSRGQQVAQGDVIVRLDDDLAVADLAMAEENAAFDGAILAARAQVASLSARRDRLQSAVNQRAIPRAEFDELLLELELAEITLLRQIQEQEMLQLQAAQAGLAVEKLVLRAPIDAIVGEDLISVGETTAGRAVATLYSIGPVRIEAFVPVTALDSLLAAEAISVTRPGADDRFDVVLDYVAPAANLSSSTISVYFTLDDGALRPGSACRLVY